MPGEESFSTIAEVAVAFLGFTGVVGVFSARAHPPAVSLRLWVMVEFGLALLLLALLPMVLHHLGWSGDTIWASSAVATILFLIGHAVLVVPRVVGYRRSETWGGVPVALEVSVPVAFGACLVSQILNLMGVGLERTHGGYLLGLYLLLTASGLNFASLLVALRGVPSDPDA